MPRYAFDPSASRFTVQAFASGMLGALGHSPTFAIREFTGELAFQAETLADVAVRLTVAAESLSLTDPVSAKDREEIEGRMRQEVLETGTYPQIVFESTSAAADRITGNWYRLQLKGNLRLHGVTGTQAVDVQLRMVDDEARLSGQCSLLLSAYRIKPVTALGGMIKLKDELKLDFELVGRKQEA